MFGALLYLRLTSLRNLVSYRVRRLRQPRYLVGAAVGGAYLYFFLLRRVRMAGMPGPAREAMGAMIVATICVFMCAMALLRIAWAWISPPATPGLQFSEAEIAFLFPAPLARKTLIHFRLLSTQLAILLTAVLMAVVFNRFSYGASNPVIRAAGLWVILSTFGLHVSGTNLTVARLKERSAHYLLWRAGAVATIVVYVAAVVWSAAAFANLGSSADLLDGETLSGLAPGLLASSPLRWLILPFRIVLAPIFAADLGGFALAMVPALALLALHYHWVSSTEYRFEEGSIVLAEKRAAIRAAALRGEAPSVGAFRRRAQPGPFPLSPTGPPEIAFLWKNLLSMRSSLLSRRTVVVALMATVWISLMLRPFLARSAGPAGIDSLQPIIVVFSHHRGMLHAASRAADRAPGPPKRPAQRRHPKDLSPSRAGGWRWGSSWRLPRSCPWSSGSLIIVCSLTVDSGGQLDWLTPAVRVAAALCLGAAAPVVCVVQLIVPNMIMLLLPGWFQSSRSRAGGIELFGQRFILGIGQLLVALLVTAPGAVAATLIIFSFRLFIGIVPAIAVAALAVLPILAGEAAVGLWFIGARFERFDPSTEIK